MGRSLAVVLLAGCAALLATTDASGQASIHAGVGVTFPLGAYGDYASTGWVATGGVAFPVGTAGLAIGVAGYFGANNHEPPPEGDGTSLYGGVGLVRYAFGDPEAVSPFLFGTAGVMVQDYESKTQPAFEGSDTGFAAGGGAGVTLPLGGIGGFAEAWLLNGFFGGGNTTIAGVTAGIHLGVGGDGT